MQFTACFDQVDKLFVILLVRGALLPLFIHILHFFNIMSPPKIIYLPNVFCWALFVLAALCTFNLVNDSLLFIIIKTTI